MKGILKKGLLVCNYKNAGKNDNKIADYAYGILKKVRYEKIRVKNMIRDYKSKNLQDILKERLNDDSGCTESKNAWRIYAGI